jgi:hypothetical protein
LSTGTSATTNHVRFSDHFKINRPQSALEFADVLLDTDQLLYVDPYSFKINDGAWYVECNNLVVDYFQAVLDAIRTGDSVRARLLLGKLSEPNATRLGHSTGTPDGRGVGRIQGEALYKRLSNSKAIRTGLLRDLSDCELLIEGIGNDKISDITTNVVNMKLIEFTQDQCRRWDVPMTRAESGPYWCPEEEFWKNRYIDLPVFNGKPIKLVPRDVIRRHMSVSASEFYFHRMLPFLQSEHLNQNTALVRVLKGGRRKGPSKKALQALHPFTKEQIFEFVEQHPEVFKRYKDDAAGKVTQLTPAQIDALVIAAGRVPQGVTVEVNNSPGAKVMLGNNVGGDNIAGNVGGSSVVNARDIQVFKQRLESAHLDQAIRDALIGAREYAEKMDLSRADKVDVVDDLGRLTKELEQPEPDGGRVRTIVKRIAVVAPAVSAILQSAKIIAEFIASATGY